MVEDSEDSSLFLTSVELAKMLRRSPRAIENMRIEGRGPPYWRLGGKGVGKIVYYMKDVEDWLVRQEGK